jgi:hypothetical protein
MGAQDLLHDLVHVLGVDLGDQHEQEEVLADWAVAHALGVVLGVVEVLGDLDDQGEVHGGYLVEVPGGWSVAHDLGDL